MRSQTELQSMPKDPPDVSANMPEGPNVMKHEERKVRKLPISASVTVRGLGGDSGSLRGFIYTPLKKFASCSFRGSSSMSSSIFFLTYFIEDTC